jgi:hypothetical protein
MLLGFLLCAATAIIYDVRDTRRERRRAHMMAQAGRLLDRG